MDRKKQTFTKPTVDLIVFDKKDDIISGSAIGGAGDSTIPDNGDE